MPADDEDAAPQKNPGAHEQVPPHPELRYVEADPEVPKDPTAHAAAVWEAAAGPHQYPAAEQSCEGAAPPVQKLPALHATPDPVALPRGQ